MANSSVTFALALRAAVRESVPAAIAVVTSMIKTLAGIPAHEVVRPGEDEPDEGHIVRSSGDWTLDEYYSDHGYTAPLELRLSGVLLAQAWEWDSWAMGKYWGEVAPTPIDVGEVTSEIICFATRQRASRNT